MWVRKEGGGEGILPKPLIYFCSSKNRRSFGREYVSLFGFVAAFSLIAITVRASPPGASSCAGCHGGNGLPALAGQPAEAVAAAMLAYQSGERAPTVMDRIARGFTETEIRAIAAWVAAPP
jgi:sulfide dehydrogenase cytochrome subunit